MVLLKLNKKAETTMKKISYTLTILAIGSLIFTGCKDSNSPGYEYMPDMYRTPAVEAYTDTMGALLPAEGTIPFNKDASKATLNFPYEYPNTIEGYEAAGANLKNPLEKTDANLADGKKLFNTFCDHCHGETGKGNGSIVKNKKFPPPPSFSNQLKDLPEGKIFHSITYGKNMMGTHASQLNQEERWKVVMYVQALQNK